MTCPFLKEAQVKFCQTASVRKLIPLAAAASTGEKCGSEAHATCPVYRASAPANEASGSCPFLRESLMQYCGAAPVTRFVPYSESLLSRCGNDSFRYCELYLGLAHPGAMAKNPDDLEVPDWLRYSANHMWLDETVEGACHIGIDAFLSRALGKVENISYLWQNGCHRPTAVLTASGLDFEVVFPNHLQLTGCNLYLRADPSRLATQPYTGGWLFEGTPVDDTGQDLIEPAQARTWMEAEQRCMNEYLQPGAYRADGGLFVAGLPDSLGQDRMRALFHEFFSPLAKRKR